MDRWRLCIVDKPDESGPYDVRMSLDDDAQVVTLDYDADCGLFRSKDMAPGIHMLLPALAQWREIRGK